MNNRIVIAALGVIALAVSMSVPMSPPAERSYIVQGASLESAANAVLAVDGDITHELGVIRAVAADLTDAQFEKLSAGDDGLRIFENGRVETAGKPVKDDGGDTGDSGTTTTDPATDTFYTTLVNGDAVHQMGIDGSGIGIAVLDTGLWKHNGIKYDAAGGVRIKAVYNAMTDSVASSPLSGDDPAGHGSHVASIAVSSLMTADATARYNGVAPGTHLVSVQAFDENGNGTYADVVRAIDWIVTNRKKYKIHIINASFSAEPRSYYWDDPINQAIMVAWQNEIFVVAAAGNRGPDPMTIGVPGNVPYVLTVGAMTDNFTPTDGSDDELASFSSTGPTVEGFVKPEVVAPGGHMRGLVQNNSELATTFPHYYDGQYFEMSGTSQATAVVSGVAALVLQAEPWRSVDEIKCKIMSAAKPASYRDKGKDVLAYSVFQQGAGRVDAYAAVMNQTVDCANNGLHIDNDLDGFQHFGGPANQQTDGSYFLRGNLDTKETGYAWDGNYADSSGYLWTEGYLWTDGYLWTEGYLWTDGVGVDGYLWTDGGGVWTDGYLWTEGYLWTDGGVWTDALTEMTSISTWVPQE